ncbi:HTH domain-containing protein [Virgibacillus halophilus]|uniref:HTH domain-containing protein n=1 Tax=Tigheibacillus halophilus TaxID=361280 RepID=A0ABU5C542_9BACI|nr:HTH domain-containing protein [Virgibacillus halophilus]
MDQRSMAVLNQLLKQDSYINVQQLAEVLNVSRRTIYSDLEKVNNWLEEHHFTQVKQVRGQGMYIDEPARKEIMTNYSFFGTTYYEFSPLERKAWAYIYIAGHDKVYFFRGF